MNNGVVTIIYPVKDIAQAKALYQQLLGTDPYMDEPYYVGFKVGNQDIGLDPNRYRAGITSPISYYQVEDIQESFKRLTDAGAQVVEAVKDVGGGKLVASVKDADNNIIGLLQMP